MNEIETAARNQEIDALYSAMESADNCVLDLVALGLEDMIQTSTQEIDAAYAAANLSATAVAMYVLAGAGFAM